MDKQGTDVTTRRRGELSEFLPEEGHRVWQESCWFVGTEKARGNDNTYPFAIVLGRERRMEE